EAVSTRTRACVSAQAAGGLTGGRREPRMAVRVLVVDDSAFMRRVIADAIASQPDMEVAGVAHNGLDALLKVEQLQPDVVTLDVAVPEMDGRTAVRHRMARHRPPGWLGSS